MREKFLRTFSFCTCDNLSLRRRPGKQCGKKKDFFLPDKSTQLRVISEKASTDFSFLGLQRCRRLARNVCESLRKIATSNAVYVIGKRKSKNATDVKPNCVLSSKQPEIKLTTNVNGPRKQRRRRPKRESTYLYRYRVTP